MKKLIYIALVLPFFLFSCEKSPRAFFSANPGNPSVGEEVWFSNESDNARSFEWDFGDGFISNEVNPVHIYGATGSFVVTLKAWSRSNLTDEAAVTINVSVPTLLEIEVLEYYEEYPVTDASVILYPTLADWDNQTNAVLEGYTDSDGKVVFGNLNSIPYYVDVWEATHDNYALRDEDVGFIRTSAISPNRINRFIAYVDYVNHGAKGEARRSGGMIIKKLERKSADKPQPGASADTSGWQELYSKRVVK